MNPNRNFRIIWTTPKFPLGIPDGARHATCSLIRHLTQLNVRVDLICLVPKGEFLDITMAEKQLGVLSCQIITRSNSKFLPIPSLKTPFTFRTFIAAGVRKNFKETLALLIHNIPPSEDTFLVFDGLHTFGVLNPHDLQDLAQECRGVIYRAHNFETTFWEQCAQKANRPWSRWFFQYQTVLVRNFEGRIARTVQLIAPVSEEDARRFERLAPGVPMSVTPIGMDFPDEKTIPPICDSGKFELLFIGRLDWIPNRNGLMWFLENIWPHLIVKRQNISLKIAGVGDGCWLQRFRNLYGIDFLGRVDNVEPLYESCALSIAPLFQGSGIRVKIIESGRYGRPVLTTALGAEGTGLVPGVTYFHAETKEEWLALLQTVTLDDCQKAGLAAFHSLRERFDGNTIAERFARVLSGVME